MSSPRRRAEIESIRAAGYLACLAGRHRQTNPYKTGYPDWLQWATGYWQGEREIEHVEQQKVLDTKDDSRA